METKNKKQKSKFKTVDMIYVALFAAIIAVCSWISVPAPVPFTLQTMAVFIALGLLGGKRGTLSVVTYVLLGAIGVPVFSGFRGGIGALFGATGGYVVGFVLSALIIWVAEHFFGNKIWVLLTSMVVGLAICYLFGTLWFLVVYTSSNGAIGFISALSMCVFPYIVPDILKIAVALIAVKRIKPYLITA